MATPLASATMALRLVEYAASHLGEHPAQNLALLSVLVVLSYRIFRYLTAHLALSRAYARHGCERPAAYPHRDPLFGLDALFANLAAARDNRFTAVSAQRFVDLGAHTYYTWILGRQAIHTTEPDNIKAALATCWKDYSIAARKSLLGKFLGRSIFVIEGDDWKRSRARLRPNFVKEQVADLTLLERHVKELFRVLPGHPATVVDLQEIFLRFTLDSASEFLFGHSTDTLVRPSFRDQEFGEAFTFSLFNFTQKVRRGALNYLHRKDPREDQAHQVCRDYVGTFVDEAMSQRENSKAGELDKEKQREDGGAKPQRYYVLEELVRVIDDREHICDEIMGVMLAGRDTTASLMSSAFQVLSRRPDLWHKLRIEIQDLHGQPPSYDELCNMKFAKYIINETLRLYPPVFQYGRTAARDTILPTGGGPNGTSPVFVPKGTGVTFSAWAMHRRKDFYGPDALEFCPERWATQRHGWDYIPFGGGPRICIGQRYALIEATYVMVRMAQEFASVEAADDTPWTEHIALTLSIKGGVKCKLTRA
ncbi:Cytochrome P450 52A3-B [Beauveria bassiana]|nr:Cytochrome P450 52A3-B [Beauveria bassiana]KAH8715442.1 Cytochrome P450 monooxygenase fsdH [Beauveria bassiana]